LNQDEVTLLLIKGLISDLTFQSQEEVATCAAMIRLSVQQSGNLGPVALALVAAEAAVKA
jgi:hypothetical protein